MLPQFMTEEFDRVPLGIIIRSCRHSNAMDSVRTVCRDVTGQEMPCDHYWKDPEEGLRLTANVENSVIDLGITGTGF